MITHPCWNSSSLLWRQNDRDGVSNNQPHDCLFNRLFWRRSKKTLKLRVSGLRVGNSSVTGEFPAQRAGNADNVSIWWRHRVIHVSKRGPCCRGTQLYDGGGGTLRRLSTHCNRHQGSITCVPAKPDGTQNRFTVWWKGILKLVRKYSLSCSGYLKHCIH